MGYFDQSRPMGGNPRLPDSLVPRIKYGLWPYLAGIIDGEGTITITTQRQYKRRTVQMKPWIRVSNTSLELIDFLVDIFGGARGKGGEPDDGHKQSYFWRVEGIQPIQEIAGSCLPFLIIKRRQAELILEFVASREEQRQARDGAPYTEREWEIQKEIRLLNRKGSL